MRIFDKETDNILYLNPFTEENNHRRTRFEFPYSFFVNVRVCVCDCARLADLCIDFTFCLLEI